MSREGYYAYIEHTGHAIYVDSNLRLVMKKADLDSMMSLLHMVNSIINCDCARMQAKLEADLTEEERAKLMVGV